MKSPSQDFENVIKAGHIDSGELLSLGRVLTAAPVPPQPLLDQWRAANGGYLPSDEFKEYIDPEASTFTKEQIEKNKKRITDLYDAIKPLPPAKAGEPAAGFILARQLAREKKDKRPDEYQLILNRPDTTIKFSPNAESFSYGNNSIVILGKVSERINKDLLIDIRGIGKNTVIDLSGIKLPEGRKLTLTIDTMRGAPKIILPRQEEKVNVLLQAADVVTQIAQPENKRKPSIVQLVAPAGTFREATVQEGELDDVNIYTKPDKSGLNLTLLGPIYLEAKTSIKTHFQLMLKDPQGKEMPIDLATIANGYIPEEAIKKEREKLKKVNEERVKAGKPPFDDDALSFDVKDIVEAVIDYDKQSLQQKLQNPVPLTAPMPREKPPIHPPKIERKGPMR